MSKQFEEDFSIVKNKEKMTEKIRSQEGQCQSLVCIFTIIYFTAAPECLNQR